MVNNESKGSYSHMTKKAVHCFLASTLNAWQQESVPADVLARANCVIVLPDVKKFGFGIGGTGGRGPMVCRQGKNFTGTSLGAATLEPGDDANQRLYDNKPTAKEIVVGNAVKPTPAGKELISLLNTKIAKRSSK